MRVLLSIKPEFVEKIMSGEKRFEFRKVLPKEKISTVVVYATMPIGKVVGDFTVQEILSLPPEQLWHTAEDGAGISKDFFDAYFNQRKIAHAFKIDQFKKYHKAMPLKNLIPSGAAPQSFCYI